MANCFVAMMRLFGRLSRVAAFCVGVLATSSLVACPTCGDGLESGGVGAGGAGHGLALGLELSVYVMLATPMLIFMGLGGLFYWQIRRAERHPELWEQAAR